MSKEWKPSKFDVDWTRNLLNILSNDATWMGDFGAIKLNQSAKTYRVVETVFEPDLKRIQRVMEGSLGYKEE